MPMPLQPHLWEPKFLIAKKHLPLSTRRSCPAVEAPSACTRAGERGPEATLDQWWMGVGVQRPLGWDNSACGFRTVPGLPGRMGPSCQQQKRLNSTHLPGSSLPPALLPTTCPVFLEPPPK